MTTPPWSLLVRLSCSSFGVSIQSGDPHSSEGREWRPRQMSLDRGPQLPAPRRVRTPFLSGFHTAREHSAANGCHLKLLGFMHTLRTSYSHPGCEQSGCNQTLAKILGSLCIVKKIRERGNEKSTRREQNNGSENKPKAVS